MWYISVFPSFYTAAAVFAEFKDQNIAALASNNIDDNIHLLVIATIACSWNKLLRFVMVALFFSCSVAMIQVPRDRDVAILLTAFTLSVALTDVLQSIESIVLSILHMPMTKHVSSLRRCGVFLGSIMLGFAWTARQVLQSALFSAVPAFLLVIQRASNRRNPAQCSATNLEFSFENMVITLNGRDVNETSVQLLDFAVFLTGLFTIDVVRRLIVSQTRTTTVTSPKGGNEVAHAHELVRAFPVEKSPMTPPRVRDSDTSALSSPDRNATSPPTPCTGDAQVNNRYFFDASEGEGDIEIQDRDVSSWSLLSPQSNIAEGDAVDASALHHVAFWSMSPGTPAAHVVTPLMAIGHPSDQQPTSLAVTSIGRKLQTRKMRIRKSLDGSETPVASNIKESGPLSSFAFDRLEIVVNAARAAVAAPVHANLSDAADFVADCTRAIQSFVPSSEVVVVAPHMQSSHPYHNHKGHTVVGVKVSEPDDDEYDLRSGRTSIESSASMSLSSVDEGERRGKGAACVHNYNTRSARNSIDFGIVG